MAKILDMPKLSPTMEEGVLLEWHKKEGESVEVDDLLAEVETDKATMEFRAFDKGVLLKQLVQANANVKLGQPVAILGSKDEDISKLVAEHGGAAATEGAKEEKEEKPAEQVEPKAEAAPEKKQEEKPAPPPKPKAPAPPAAKGSLLDRTQRFAEVEAHAADGGNGARVLASPYVRKMARERGIELAGAQGSGQHGRIELSDLESIQSAKPAANGTSKQLEKAAAPASTALAVPGLAEPEVRPLSQMRKTIARRLTESKQTVPHFYLTIDVDASPVLALRESINAELAEGAAKSKDAAAKPEKISVNDLLIKAIAGALTRVPECNAQFTPEALLIHRRIDISVAVAIPDGLITPVVRTADQKSVVAIAREVRDLAARARTKKLKPEEMSNGTFSISNLGMFGIDEFSAVINPPEGAILAVGQARDEPVVKGGQVVAGKKMAMTLSCDHRVIDGAVGASFLAELRALLEHPMRILSG